MKLLLAFNLAVIFIVNSTVNNDFFETHSRIHYNLLVT